MIKQSKDELLVRPATSDQSQRIEGVQAKSSRALAVRSANRTGPRSADEPGPSAGSWDGY